MTTPTYLVLGSTGGIGRVLCERLAKRGASLVRTPLAERLTKAPASLAASEAMHPLGRIGDPEDVASAIEWLLEPGNTWVSGKVIGVDGGLATLRGKARA